MVITVLIICQGTQNTVIFPNHPLEWCLGFEPVLSAEKLTNLMSLTTEPLHLESQKRGQYKSPRGRFLFYKTLPPKEEKKAVEFALIFNRGTK